MDEIEGAVANFLYYDRKDDDDLPQGNIERAIKNGVITIDEIVIKFKLELEKGLK